MQRGARGAMLAAMEGLRARYADSTLRLTSLDNVITAAWFNAPEVEHMRIIDRLTRAVRRSEAVGFCFVNIAVDGVPRFSREVIAELERMAEYVTEKDLSTAHVILVDGLVGTAVRTFMSTVMLVTRPRDPNKVFADIESASRWTYGYLSRAGGYDWSLERLVAYLNLAIER